MWTWMGDTDMLGERADALCANAFVDTDDCKEEKKNRKTKRKKKTY